ncbi:MAG: tetratricopeptide repeat protein, partial [Candidatus Korobacteraceae bacterium]
MLALGCLLAVVTLALYHPVNHYPFANADDDSYIGDNAHVKYGFEPDTVTWAFTTFRDANWHPVTWLSHALDCHLYSLDAGKHHRTNVLLHAINSVLLFWVLLQATGYAGRSAMVAALFALHPINVESVVWISERKNLLSMLFFLLALGAYRWYASKPGAERYTTVALLYALGLMCKPQVITFPFVLLLWDFWPLERMSATTAVPSAPSTAATMPGRSFSWLVVEKLPLFVISAASAVITVKAQAIGGAMSGPLNTYPFLLRLGNAVVSYVRYIGKAIWPSQLALMYPHSPIAFWQVFASFLLLAVVTGTVILRRRYRYLMVGWFWFLGTLIPMIGLVQVGAQAMADRYAYLPFVGLFIMICWGVSDWWQERNLSPAWLAAPGLAVLVTLAIVTHRQISYWRDNVTLWAHTVHVTHGNWIAENNLGAALLDDGRMDDAVVHFRAAEAIYPYDPRTFLFIGFYEQHRGNLRAAIEEYQHVISVTKNDVWNNAKLRDDAFVNMGNAYRDLGDSARAAESYAAAESQRREFL